METNKIYKGDAIEVLKTFPDKCIDMLMTSPPYWALRDYGEGVESIWDGDKECDHIWNSQDRKIHSGVTKSTVQASVDKKGGFATDWTTTDHFCSKCGAWKGQLGLEPNFNLYIKHLCNVFDEVKRPLKDTGSIFINIGDTYGSGKGERIDNPKNIIQRERPITKGYEKCLCMIPFRFAIEMVNRGWILRNTIIWYKPNCMPSSIKDRFTVDFEYLFFFSKKKKYYFEQQIEPNHYDGRKIMVAKRRKTEIYRNEIPRWANPEGRNKRCVWTINPQPFPHYICFNCGYFGRLKKEEEKKGYFGGEDISEMVCPECKNKVDYTSHFAIFPEELCEIPIRSCCPEFVCKKCGKPRFPIIKPSEEYAKHLGKGWHNHEHDKEMGFGQQKRGHKLKTIKADYRKVGLTDCGCNVGFESGIALDPFIGSGTTGIVALKQGKRFVGIDLNQEYIDMANNRLKPFLEQKRIDGYRS